MKKRIFSIFLACAMCLSLLPMTALATGSSDPGETSVAKVVAGESTLYYTDLHEALEAGKAANSIVTLLKDVTLDGNWSPVTNFNGTFDGKNRTITGLTVVANDHAGLFANMSGSTMKNIIIDSAKITAGENGENSYAAVICGSAGTNTVFQNITIKNSTVVAIGQYVGAVIGADYPKEISGCTITDCHITGFEQVGGLIGYTKSGDIKNNVINHTEGNATTITALNQRVGGIVGKLQTDSGEGCFVEIKDNQITATLNGSNSGGIYGQIMGNWDRYSITGNEIDVPGAGNPIGTLRADQSVDFTSKLAQNITGNWWTDETLGADSFTYTADQTGTTAQTIHRAVASITNADGKTHFCASIAEAVEYFNDEETPAGNYTIKVEAGTYKDADMVINQRNGYHLTIQPASETAKVTIAPESTSSKVFLISGQSNAGTNTSVTIENINFDFSQATAENEQIAVWFLNGDDRYGHNVTIEKCTVTAEKPENAAKVMLSGSEADTSAFNITIQNCELTNAGYVFSGYAGCNGADFGIKVINTPATGCKAYVNNQGSGSTYVDGGDKGVAVSTWGDYAVRTNGSGKLTVKNVDFSVNLTKENPDSTTGVIVVRKNSATAEVSGCTFSKTLPTQGVTMWDIYSENTTTTLTGDVSKELGSNVGYNFSLESQAAPAKGDGYTTSVSGDTVKLQAKDKYEILVSGAEKPTADAVPIESGKSYFIRLKETDEKLASPYTAIDTTVTIGVLAYPETMGKVSISGVGSDGKCGIGTTVTVTAAAYSGYEFVGWLDAKSATKSTNASYPFTATVSDTLTAQFKPEDKTVATPPTVADAEDRVYTGESITGIENNGTGCTLAGTTSATAVGTYTATATLTEGYDVWPDGTTAPMTITWSIYKKSREAPVNIKVENGSITSVDNTMEYMKKGGTSYTEVTGTTISNPGAGTYYVRYKASDNYDASPSTVVTVGTPTLSVSTLQPTALTETTATLHGVVDSYSDNQNQGFEYKAKGDGDEAWKSVTSTQGTSFSANITGLTPDTDYTVRAYATNGAGTSCGSEYVFHTTATSTGTGTIIVGASMEGTNSKKVIFSVEKGNDVIASAISRSSLSSGDSYQEIFDELPDGIYNVVVRTEDGEYTETRTITIENGSSKTTLFTIPAGKLAIIVDVKTENTPKIAVEGLADILTSEDKNTVAKDSTTKIEVKLEAKDETNSTDTKTKTAVDAIKNLIPDPTETTEENIKKVLDLSLYKTTSSDTKIDIEDIGVTNGKVVEVAIPYETVNKTLNAYRYHDSVAEKLTSLNNRPTANFIDGTCFIGTGYVFIYASGFSDYAISEVSAVAPKSDDSDSTNTPSYSGGSDRDGGGSSISTTYRASVTKSSNGTVRLNKTNAAKGTTVTITLTPDAGYVVDTVKVTDANGDNVDTARTDDTHYTFTMPAAKVTVAATFRSEGAEVDSRPEPVPQTGNFPFGDVSESDWFRSAVEYVYEKGLMNGVSDLQFAPYDSTTRAMVVTILWRMAGSPVVDYALPFADVPEGQWYTDAIRWAASAGVVKGVSDAAFAPDSPVTREELTTMLYRAASNPGEIGDVPIAQDDAYLISDWAAEAMQWAVKTGILHGDDRNHLNPQNTATRAEIATIFRNLEN